MSDEDLTRCVREIDNVRGALDWCFFPTGDPAIGVDLTVAYVPIWWHLSLTNESRERCERALISLQPHATVNTWSQMQLRIALGSSLITTMGSASQAVTVLTQALEIAEALDDIDARARVLSGLLNVFTFRGEYVRARTAVERLEQIADRIGDPASARFADRMMGNILFTTGRPREVQQYFERVLGSSVVPRNRFGMILDDPNAHSAARAMLAQAPLLQGCTERALHEARASLDDVRGTDPPIVLCRALYQGICRIAIMIGDFATADREIACLIELSRDLNAHLSENRGRILQGRLLVERGAFVQGLTVLRDASKTYEGTGWHLSHSEFKGALALALAGTGRPDEALGVLDDAMTFAGERESGTVWYVPELLRIKGEVLLLQAADQSVQAAETCFNQAGAMAHEQDALFWELRIAVSLARLRVTQGRHCEARALLAPVYDRFTDGFMTADLRAARGILDSISA